MPRFTLLLLCIVVALPLSATLVVGPERAVSGVTHGPTPGGELPLDVVTDGTDYLVLWGGGGWGHEDRAGLYAAKVTENGAVSPVPSLRLSREYVHAAYAAWTGSSYLLVWQPVSGGLMSAQLDRDARLVRGPSRISSAARTVAALAWDGRRALAVTGEAGGVGAILLGPNGEVVRDGIILGNRGPSDSSVVVAGGAFFVVWAVNERAGAGAVLMARVTTDGEASAPVTLVNPPTSVGLDADSDGQRVGIAITELMNKRLRRFTVDARSFGFTEHAAAQAPFTPAVVAAAGEFVSAHITPAATIDAIPFQSMQVSSNRINIYSPSVLLTATNGRTTLAVWPYGFTAGALFDVRMTRKVTDVFPISTSAVSQDRPELAPAGDIALLTWTEEIAGGANLVGVRVDASGTPVGAPALIASGDYVDTGHAAVFTGRLWLVTWQEREGQAFPRTFVQRVRADGVPIGEPLDFGTVGPATLASNGALTLMALVERDGLVVYRFSPDGALIDSRPSVADPNRYAGNIAMASNGREFLLAWDENTSNGSRMVGKRLDPSGNVIDAAPIAIESNAPWWVGAPRVASDGTDYYVAYERRISPSRVEVQVKRVLRTGALADTTASGPGTVVGEGFSPRIAMLGTRPVVSFMTRGLDLPLQLVLKVVGESEATVVPESPWSPHHALASRGASLWSAYARIPADVGRERVFVRTVGESQAPTRRRAARR